MDLDVLKPEDPRRLGDYELRGRLGEGGQGVVYLGESPTRGRVAVKLLRPGFADDSGMLERFVREAETAQRVAPFCTAQIYTSGTHEGRPYLVTEYIEGPSLHEAVVTGGPKSGPALHRLAVGTITALTAIHQAGIVHRDLKPRNVLLAPDGPRVIDFGIAKALDVTSSLTGAPIGTPAYIAPEILAGHTAGPAADLFSWGCTIAFTAQGGSPFEANSLHAIINKILNSVPDLGGMAEPLRQIVADCLDKEPGRRPTAEQVLLRLLQRPALAPGVMAEAAAVAGAETAPPPPGPQPAASFGYPPPGPPLPGPTWPGNAAHGAPAAHGATYPQGAPP
ncbi:MAG: serine/threonine-protein kinase, partial [Streptosporangiaceae bacterium]